jgi:hypothetical protein
MFALGFGEALLFLAFGTLAVHLAVLDVVGEYQAAAGAFGAAPLANLGSASLNGADKDRLAGAAPVFSFFQFLAHRAFIHISPHHSKAVSLAVVSRISDDASQGDGSFPRKKPGPGPGLKASLRGPQSIL